MPVASRARELDDDAVPTGTVVDPSLRGADAAELAPGARVGRYLILEPLGRGGMGVVYRASDPELNRDIALKVIKPERGSGAASVFRERLLREATALAQLSHPNVVPVFDVGSVEGAVFVAMELVHGQTLRHWAGAGARSWREIVAHYAAAGDGLAAAHAAGIVHRDFKPDNVLIGRDGRVRVIDFGLARAAADEAALGEASTAVPSAETAPDESSAGGVDTSSGAPTEGAERPGDSLLRSPLTVMGAAIGTPRYMAPEQHLGRPVDAACDQFAFCVSLYEALYGQRAFRGRNRAAIKRAVLAGNVREPPGRSKVPARVRRIVLRGLSPDPADRYPSMDALLTALRRDRRALWRTIAVSAAVAVVAGVVVFALTGRAGNAGAAPCDGAAERIAPVWSTDQVGALRTAFAATGSPHARPTAQRVAGALDDFVAAWIAAHIDACQATHVRSEQSEAMLDMRMRCLERRRLSAREAVAVLMEPTAAIVDKAVSLVLDATDLDGCDPDHLLGELMMSGRNRRAGPEVDELHAELDRAAVLASAGRYDDALTVVEALAPRVVALDDQPLVAAAHHRRGTILMAQGKYPEAEAALEQAMLTAGTARDDRLLARAAIAHFEDVAYHQSRHREGVAMRPQVAAIVARVGDRRLEAELRAKQAYLHSVRGEYAEAVADFEASLAAHREAYDADHPVLGRSHANLGLALAYAGQHDRAAEAMNAGREILERALGPEHPTMASLYSNLALVQQARQQLAEAEALYRRALALDRANHGDAHPRIATWHANLASLLIERKQYDVAETEARRGLDLALARAERDPPQEAQLRNNLGKALMMQGQLEAAEPELRQALALREEALGRQHRDVAYVLENLAELHARRARYRDARAALDRALGILEQALPDSDAVGGVLASLARVHLLAGAESESLAAAERALAIYGAGDPASQSAAATHAAALRAASPRFVRAQILWRRGSRQEARAEAERAAAAYRQAGEDFSRELEELRAWLDARQ